MDGRRPRAAPWLVVVFCALIIGATSLALAARRPAAPSSASPAPGGMEGLYLLLRDEGVPVSRITGPVLPAGGVVVAAAGPAPVSAASAARLLRFASAGGVAVVLGPVPALAAALHVEVAPWPWGAARAQAAVALPALRGADTLYLPQGVLLFPARGAAPLYTALGQPAVLRLPVGRGTVYWLGSAAAWSNAVLARHPGNLALAQALLAGRGPVRFDEYAFGAGRAAVPPPARAPRPESPPLPLPRGAGPALAAGVLAAAAALWSAGWRRHPVRCGPASPPAGDEPVRAFAEMLLQTAPKGDAGA